jgi:transketolase
MRDAFVRSLFELAGEDPTVFFLTADLGVFIFDDFKTAYPGRYINLGIAEANMIGVSAGLAASGKMPYAYSIAPFITSRCLDQIRVDICYHRSNVKLVGVGAGFVYGSLGATHHAIEDIAVMRALPGMTVIAPADPLEAEKATRAIHDLDGPAYLRLGRNNDPVVYGSEPGFKIGKANIVRSGKDAAIIATGTAVYSALQAADMLDRDGIDVRVIDMHTVKPVDMEAILQAEEEAGALITVEEHNILGGLGSAVAEVLSEHTGVKKPFRRLGLKDTFCTSVGTPEYIREQYGLDPKNIARTIQDILADGSR